MFLLLNLKLFQKFFQWQSETQLFASPYIWLALYFTLYWTNFRGELKHVDNVSEQKIKYWATRAQEIGGVRLQDELFAKYQKQSPRRCLVKKKFLKVSQYTQMKTPVLVFFQIKLKAWRPEAF